MNLAQIDSSYCYDHVQMGLVITKRSDVYIVSFHLLWIVALEPCCQNRYWLGRADGSWVWLFMWGLTWVESMRPKGWELHTLLYSICQLSHMHIDTQNKTRPPSSSAKCSNVRSRSQEMWFRFCWYVYVVLVINQGQFKCCFLHLLDFWIHTVLLCSQQKESMSKQQQEACKQPRN